MATALHPALVRPVGVHLLSPHERVSREELDRADRLWRTLHHPGNLAAVYRSPYHPYSAPLTRRVGLIGALLSRRSSAAALPPATSTTSATTSGNSASASASPSSSSSSSSSSPPPPPSATVPGPAPPAASASSPLPLPWLPSTAGTLPHAHVPDTGHGDHDHGHNNVNDNDNSNDDDRDWNAETATLVGSIRSDSPTLRPNPRPLPNGFFYVYPAQRAQMAADHLALLEQEGMLDEAAQLASPSLGHEADDNHDRNGGRRTHRTHRMYRAHLNDLRARRSSRLHLSSLDHAQSAPPSSPPSPPLGRSWSAGVLPSNRSSWALTGTNRRHSDPDASQARKQRWKSALKRLWN